MRYGRAAAGLALAMLHAAPSQAQRGSCDSGRGGLMTYLGFESPRRSMRTDQRNGRMELTFDAGPRITGVHDRGPAAGRLRDGDVLIAIDGLPITAPEGARRYSEIHPGERVRFSVRRGARVEEVSITAAGRCIPHPPTPPEAPAAPSAPVPPNPPTPPRDEIMPEGRFGFAIDCQNCGADERTGVFRFREPPVVVSVEPNSPAARAGLRPGDRLSHADGVSLTSRAGWPRFRAIRPGQEVRFTYTRAGETHHRTMSALPPPDAKPARERAES